MKKIGAHISASGGVENAPINASLIGAKTFAFFTKNQRQWKSPPLKEDNIKFFKKNCEQFGYEPEYILPHDTYLINMGSPDPEIRKKSEEAFLDELKRCELLGLKMLNFHPGSHRGEMSDEDCLNSIANSVNRCLMKTDKVVAVIENTAGQGGSVGRNFEQIKYLIDQIKDKSRIGVCLDTCHLFASGYDLRTKDSYEYTINQFEKIIGLNFLKGWHLNDSKSEFKSNVDRHESLGKGNLGINPFKFIVKDKRFENIPLILETPEPDLWEEEIKLLYSFA
ncbi:MAG: deoxyribonuclease IV [Thermoanaerobaculaceae bacterium]|nr:deoxyribonuclease IV [Thermoanaerobaculaceae bacterium]